jgi:peptidoglycan/xylan/chitin deacetylase (PgdA/CDA1 family)
MRKKINVPVIMYHSIGVPNKQWDCNFLTCPYQLFESQLKWMKNKNFRTLSLKQLYDYMNEGISIPENSVVLTFDDGFLDNWIFAYPLLKKYGYAGTIYVNSEFVDPRNLCRKTLQEVWDKKFEIDKLETTGFLSWPEMRQMVKEEVMDIQSHAMTHTWYFKNNTIVDFRHPRDKYHWITWNNHPNKKPYLQIDNDELINYGEPIYEYGKALEVQRYFPDEDLSRHLITYVKEAGAKKFFLYPDWKKKLFEIAESYKKENKLNDKFETEEEYSKRIMYELKASKEIIEKKLDTHVNFLSWPNGGATQKTVEISSKIGYISSTLASDIRIDVRRKIKNTYGDNPARIRRIGPILYSGASSPYWNSITGYDSRSKYKNGFFLILSLYNYQERKIIAPISKAILGGIAELHKIANFLQR